MNRTMTIPSVTQDFWNKQAKDNVIYDVRYKEEKATNGWQCKLYFFKNYSHVALSGGYLSCWEYFWPSCVHFSLNPF